jgi:hypothetical protein
MDKTSLFRRDEPSSRSHRQSPEARRNRASRGKIMQGCRRRRQADSCTIAGSPSTHTDPSPLTCWNGHFAITPAPCPHATRQTTRTRSQMRRSTTKLHQTRKDTKRFSQLCERRHKAGIPYQKRRPTERGRQLMYQNDR